MQFRYFFLVSFALFSCSPAAQDLSSSTKASSLTAGGSQADQDNEGSPALTAEKAFCVGSSSASTILSFSPGAGSEFFPTSYLPFDPEAKGYPLTEISDLLAGKSDKQLWFTAVPIAPGKGPIGPSIKSRNIYEAALDPSFRRINSKLVDAAAPLSQRMSAAFERLGWAPSRLSAPSDDHALALVGSGANSFVLSLASGRDPQRFALDRGAELLANPSENADLFVFDSFDESTGLPRKYLLDRKTSKGSFAPLMDPQAQQFGGTVLNSGVIFWLEKTPEALYWVSLRRGSNPYREKLLFDGVPLIRSLKWNIHDNRLIISLVSLVNNNSLKQYLFFAPIDDTGLLREPFQGSFPTQLFGADTKDALKLRFWWDRDFTQILFLTSDYANLSRVVGQKLGTKTSSIRSRAECREFANFHVSGDFR